MTLAPDAPPPACRDVDDAIAVLRERGLRLSTSRRLVLEALFAAESPVTPEQLDPVRSRVRELFGHQARFTYFALVGVCPQGAEGPASRP